MPQVFSRMLLPELASMRRYAFALAKDHALADDIVQDALVLAIERRASFREGAPVRSWVLAIVHNVFISTQRKQAAEIRRDAKFAEMLVDRADASQEHGAYLRQVAQSFAALPDPQRQVLHLVAIEDLSYFEAGEVLQIPIGTVMSRLSRARAALRQHGEIAKNATAKLRIVGGTDGG